MQYTIGHLVIHGARRNPSKNFVFTRQEGTALEGQVFWVNYHMNLPEILGLPPETRPVMGKGYPGFVSIEFPVPENFTVSAEARAEFSEVIGDHSIMSEQGKITLRIPHRNARKITGLSPENKITSSFG